MVYIFYRLRGYDVKCPDKGAVFHFEITVVKPHIFTSLSSAPQLKYSSVLFKAGEIHRHFLMVPDQVSYAGIGFFLNLKIWS